MLIPNALLSHFVLEPLRVPEPSEHPTNFREYQIKENYDFMQGTLTAAELGVSFAPIGEILQAGRLAAGKAPMLVGMGSGGGELVSFSEQWVAQAEGSVLKGASQHFKGVVGEERTVADILERGGDVIGKHVMFVGPTGQRTTVDVVWVDAEGILRGTEAKFGEYAKLTKPQSIVFPQGGHMTLTPVGERAAEAGLTPGQAVGIHIDIARWLF
jgi:hypothetical protein